MHPEIEIPPSPDYALKVRHKVTSGWEQWYLLIGDCHWDSPECGWWNEYAPEMICRKCKQPSKASPTVEP